MNTGTLLGITLCAGALFLFFYFARRKPLVSLSAGIFLASFLPVSNIIFPIGAPAGERWFFYPSLGIALLVSLALSALLTHKRRFVPYVIVICVILAFVVYGFITFTRQSAWLSDERLFSSAVQCAPKSVLSRSNRGAVYLLKGDIPSAKRELETAHAIAPIYSKGLSNLGLTYWKDGQSERAREMYHDALKQDFPYAGAMENLALLYLSEGKTEDARRWLNLFFDGNAHLSEAYIKTHQVQ